MTSLIRTVLLCAVIPPLAIRALPAQSLFGTSGLLLTPSAHMPPDRTIGFGLSYINEGWFPREVFFEGLTDQHHGVAYHVMFGYLPFLELGLRLHQFIDLPRSQGLGDRVITIRVRAIEETTLLPSIVLGIHDLIGTRFFNSAYVVASKHVAAGQPLGRVGFHIGFAGDWMEAAYHDLDGVFGGIAVHPIDHVSLLFEYDTRRFNGGIRGTLLDRIQVQLAAQGLEALSAGLSYRMQL